MSEGVSYKDPSSGHALDIGVVDAPVVSIGDTNPFPTPSGTWQPDPSQGVFSCLYDNIWGCVDRPGPALPCPRR